MADIDKLDESGKTKLYCAVERNDFEEARKLLKDGADVNCKTLFNRTPLYASVKKPNTLKMVKLLVENQADVNSEAVDSEPLIFTAASFSSADVVAYLAFKGAKVNREFGNER